MPAMRLLPVFSLMFLSSVMVLRAGEKPPQEHVVKAGMFRDRTEAQATFVPARGIPLKLDPLRWKSVVLKDLKPHGARVRAGETLAVVDTRELEERVEDLRREVEGARIGMARAVAEHEAWISASDLEGRSLRQASDEASRDEEEWRGGGRALEEEEARREVLEAEQQLEYSKEELRQLEAMYKADEITEETEEIILKRSRWAVERAEFSLRLTRDASRRALEIRLPRNDVKLRVENESRRQALQAWEAQAGASRRAREIELDGKRLALTRLERQFDEAEADLRMLGSMAAEKDGWFLRGDWTTPDALASHARCMEKMAASARPVFQPGDTLGTLVTEDDPLRLAALVVADGAPASGGAFVPYAFAASAPWTALPLEAVPPQAGVPDAQGRWPMAFRSRDEAGFRAILPGIVPGMRARVVVAERPELPALTVPPEFLEAGHSSDGGGIVHAFVKTAEKPEGVRRPVKTGRWSAGAVEILEGLTAGDVLLAVP